MHGAESIVKWPFSFFFFPELRFKTVRPSVGRKAALKVYLPRSPPARNREGRRKLRPSVRPSASRVFAQPLNLILSLQAATGRQGKSASLLHLAAVQTAPFTAWTDELEAGSVRTLFINTQTYIALFDHWSPSVWTIDRLGTYHFMPF